MLIYLSNLLLFPQAHRSKMFLICPWKSIYCLSIYFSIHLLIYLSNQLFFPWKTYIYLSVYLAIYVSSYLSIHLLIYLSNYSFFHKPINQNVSNMSRRNQIYLSICQSIYLSIYLLVYLSIYLTYSFFHKPINQNVSNMSAEKYLLSLQIPFYQSTNLFI